MVHIVYFTIKTTSFNHISYITYKNIQFSDKSNNGKSLTIGYKYLKLGCGMIYWHLITYMKKF
jgi:hypothetical protein